MITVCGVELVSTKFPDGTSQVWKLPKEILSESDLQVDWRFQHEREFFDLLSLRLLCPKARFHLYIPFLPFGRQDKPIGNESTFNLAMFGKLLGMLEPHQTETLDAHNPKEAAKYGIQNIRVDHFHYSLIDRIKADALVFPDAGAANRYSHPGRPALVFEKHRDQASGEILGHKLLLSEGKTEGPITFLILDDICDGGATFISVAKALNIRNPGCKIHLFTTHGIFSKGLHPLEQAGIRIHTTNSIKKNEQLLHNLRITRV